MTPPTGAYAVDLPSHHHNTGLPAGNRLDRRDANITQALHLLCFDDRRACIDLFEISSNAICHKLRRRKLHINLLITPQRESIVPLTRSHPLSPLTHQQQPSSLKEQIRLVCGRKPAMQN
ncbi:hypothetical protein HA466_0170300 [Hirschfeldia incana]|nr:hypothetical protein HA466_0170300 [Hirschfeldia incana]